MPVPIVSRLFSLAALLTLCVAAVALTICVERGRKIDPLPVGAKVVPFAARTADGQTYRSEGKKKILVLFYSAACPHCRAEVAQIDSLSTVYPESIQPLGVLLGPANRQDVPWKADGPSFPVVREGGEEIAEMFGVVEVPTYFCVDDSGTIIGRSVGLHSIEWDANIVRDFVSR
ncbi:MAG TPA: TlpA disulfide reductase family protein [Bacteroidota bacterium]|nr:TlpA disulfide reductase family protein [Bacteroidota bacterium]